MRRLSFWAAGRDCSGASVVAILLQWEMLVGSVGTILLQRAVLVWTQYFLVLVGTGQCGRNTSTMGSACGQCGRNTS